MKCLKYTFPGIVPWVAAIVVAVVTSLWLALDTHVSLDFMSMLAPTGIVAWLLTVGVFLRSRYADNAILMRVCQCHEALAYLMFTFSVLRIVNHMAMTLPFPMADDTLLSWDRAMGFDWVAYANFMADKPTLIWLFQHFYFKTLLITAATVVVLFVVNNTDRAREFLLLMVATGTVTTLVASAFPADGAMATLGTKALQSKFGGNAGIFFIQSLHYVHDNADVVLVFDKLLGIASFPSFHTITGLLMLYACRGHRVLTALALVYVPIMISSTPLVGGHYFADLVSGAALVIVSILALKWAGSSSADKLAYAS